MIPVALRPTEVVAGRPFTALELTKGDLSILYQMLAELRTLLEEAEAGTRKVVPFQRMAWRVDGLTHRVIICDENRLRAHPELCVVGFFAERRTEIDITPLEEANAAVVAEFTDYPGILSYSSTELSGGHWANIVLHDEPMDAERWRQGSVHARAVEVLSPVHYRNVRIHNAQLTAHLFDDFEIAVKMTKYFDFAGESHWQAQRTAAGSPRS